MRTYAVDQSSPGFPRIERGILAGRDKEGITASGILTEIIVVGRQRKLNHPWNRESFSEKTGKTNTPRICSHQMKKTDLNIVF